MKSKLIALTLALATVVAMPAAVQAAPQQSTPQESPAVASEMVVEPAGVRVESWSKNAPAAPPTESLGDPAAQPPDAATAEPVPPVDPAPVGEPVPSEPEPEPEAQTDVGSAPGATAEPGGPAEPAQPDPAAPDQGEPGGKATATNDSLTFQVLVQVQRGCRSVCHGTSQTQVAEQIAQTTQEASADTDAEGGEALAANHSRTLQFVWQAQLGCVAFCYGTSQLQLAGQQAQTTQTASASGATATALNESHTGQYAFQFQRGCVYECYDAAQAQALAQNARASQDAYATSSGDDEADLEELRSAFSGIEAWARNLNATIQFAFQFQDGDCRQDCHGEAQTQAGTQQAATVQHASATAVVGGRRPGLE